MTLRHLKIFICVCDHKSITSASKSLYISQPSVSQAIKELEAYYSIPLFERIGKRIFITYAGKKLLSYARHIISLYNNIEKEMKEISEAGFIRIGASATIGTYILLDLIERFKKINGEVTIETNVENTKSIEQLILTDKLDIGLVEGSISSPDIIETPFMDDELVLIFNSQSKLLGQKVINPTDIDGMNFIVREGESGSRQMFESLMASNSISWQKSWVCNNYETIKNAVISGIGISFISKMAIKEELNSKKLFSNKINGVNLKRKFKIIYHKNKFLTPTTKKFIDYVLKLCINF